MVHSACIK